LITASWVDSAQGAAAVIQAVVVLLAAAWAYVKFSRGPKLVPTADVSIRGSLVVLGRGARTLLVNVTVRNTGLAELPLRVTLVEVYGVTESAVSAGNGLDWGDSLTRAHLFDQHASVTVGETLVDAVLIPVPILHDVQMSYDLPPALDCR
jgi:hypothetical protein